VRTWQSWSLPRTDSLQLGTTLRWLACGSYLDVAQHYGVISTTFYDLVNAGCNAIVETFPIVFDMCIECSFGILVGRWGFLWKPLRVLLHRAPVVIEACMTLHNLCIDRSLPQEIRPPKQSRSGNPSHRPHINNNGGPSSLLTDLFHYSTNERFGNEKTRACD